MIKVKEVLKDLEAKKPKIDLGLESCRTGLQYFKRQGGQMDKMIEQLGKHSNSKHVRVV